MSYTEGSLATAPDIVDYETKRLYVVLGKNPSKENNKYIGVAIMKTRKSISIKIKTSDLIKGKIDTPVYVYPWIIVKLKEKDIVNKKGKLKNQLTKKIIRETEKHIDLSL